MRVLLPTLFPIMLALSGCAENGLAEFSDDIDTSTETGFEDDSDTAPSLPDATWAGLSGQLAIAAGEIDLANTSLSWTFYDGQLDSVCLYAAPAASATTLAPPDPDVYGWWSVATDNTDDDGSCAYPRPTELELGLGALDAQLFPAMADADLDDSASPYGLYARVGWESLDTDTPLWVFGIAGTTGSFDGSEPAVNEGPLPDGQYTLEPLHLFAVP